MKTPSRRETLMVEAEAALADLREMRDRDAVREAFGEVIAVARYAHPDLITPTTLFQGGILPDENR